MSRTDKDYAIEFGEYLAKAADHLLDAANRRDQLKEEEAPEEMQDQAGEAYSDHFGSLRNAAYEFRKRAERAKASAVPEALRITPAELHVLISHHLVAGSGALLQDDFSGHAQHRQRLVELRAFEIDCAPSPLRRIE